MQLDDLVVVLRYLRAARPGDVRLLDRSDDRGPGADPAVSPRSRVPRRSSRRSAARGSRNCDSKWGCQSIVVDGIDPRTRVARVLVEADYRMKLVGMGLEKGTMEVPSYLDLIHAAPGQAPPPMDVLRWWFTLKYDAVHATTERNAFELRGHRRASAQRKRAAHSSRPAGAHGQIRSAQPGVCRAIYRSTSRSWPKNIRSMPICRMFSIWPWSRR